MQNQQNIKEIWKPIKGYERLYQVSTLGRVKSLNYNKTKKEKILSPGNNGNGYLFVTLYKNGRKNLFVHRLVAEAFLENPDNLPEVNHKDENKTNNSVSNLEFCSRKYNARYSNAKKVGCYREGNFIKVYDSTIDVTNDGFNQGNVVSCCQGKLKTYKGFQWKYL